MQALLTESQFYKLQVEQSEQDKQFLHHQLSKEFELLANSILQKKTKDFQDDSNIQLNQLLHPLKEKLQSFEHNILQFQMEQGKQQSSLIEKIKQLSGLNQQMSKDAMALTNALKGDNKFQGNWGEMVLERILEKAGLEKDREYFVQHHFKNEMNRGVQPDIIIQLPQQKQIIVDSKVSLTAYEQLSRTQDIDERTKLTKAHLISLRQHINSLSEKNYQSIYEISSLDFVLLFIPIEGAFALAMQSDNNLYYEAMSKNLIIVSPTTLLATARTISNVWQQELQHKNAKEIAYQSGLLYDKFVGFVKDLEKIGNQIQTVEISYQAAMNKLATGKGNLIRKAEKIKNLGAANSKNLDTKKY
ncbi:UNVERIFIED_CONTAM: hypothetical protein GTU68_037507 [Idotea baltica]|nr:hypothetical protein [Idotea baltica]